MNVVHARTLFEFNHWANRRLLASSRLLPGEDFTRDLGSSHGSVRGTLVHLIGGQWVWLRLWLGEPSKQIVERCETVWALSNFPDVSGLEAAHAELEKDQISFLSRITDDDMGRRRGFENFQGQHWEFSLSELMQHVVNHSTYHRGQVVTLLRQLEVSPPATDYLIFLLERPRSESQRSAPAFPTLSASWIDVT